LTALLVLGLFVVHQLALAVLEYRDAWIQQDFRKNGADSTPSAATDNHIPLLKSTTPTLRGLVRRTPMPWTYSASTPVPMKGMNTSPAMFDNHPTRSHTRYHTTHRTGP